MKLFRYGIEDYYDNGMLDYPVALRIFYYVVIAVLYAFTKLMWRWKVENAEALIAPGKTGTVIICNHTSMAEVVALVPHIVRTGRRVRPIMKSEFNRNPIVKWFFGRVGGIPVDRGTADMKALRRAQHALQRGEDVLIYPEGTRVKDDAQAKVHGGYALMAQMAKAPVQPVAVIGARNLRVRSRVWLKAGRPVEWSEIDAPKRREQVAKMEEVGMGRVFELRDELRQAHPGLE